ncbi:MAG: hypothetical protein KF911_06185 [Pseudomonadales bacterium]|nr:hypothetical protein [Pseudomonadales bacterium]
MNTSDDSGYRFQQRLLPGDIVARRKGPVMHKGVVMPDGRILHNTPARGEHLSSLAEFAAGRTVTVTRNGCGESRARAYRAAPRPGARYHLFANNCEHTVSRTLEGRERSPQLRGWIAGIGIAAVAFAVTRHPGVTAAGFALGRRFAERFTSRA